MPKTTAKRLLTPTITSILLEWVELVRIGLVAAAVVASWFGLWKPFAGST